VLATLQMLLVSESATVKRCVFSHLRKTGRLFTARNM